MEYGEPGSDAFNNMFAWGMVNKCELYQAPYDAQEACTVAFEALQAHCFFF